MPTNPVIVPIRSDLILPMWTITFGRNPDVRITDCRLQSLRRPPTQPHHHDSMVPRAANKAPQKRAVSIAGVSGTGQPGSQPNQALPRVDESGEEFNFQGVDSDNPGGDETTQGRTQRTSRSSQPRSKGTGAPDMKMAFKTTDEGRRVCLWCGSVSFKLFLVVVSQTFRDQPKSYGPTTGNDPMRKHLKTKHTQQYQEACRTNGWKYLDPKEPTIGENRQSRLPPFLPETFLEYLVRFVTADDQVRVAPCLC